MSRILGILFVASVFLPASTLAQEWNFPDRKALIVDACPHVKITSFRFENTIEGRAGTSRHQFNYRWKNVSDKPVLAFEIVTLKYDPFDEPLPGSRTVIAGKNSANFSALMAGEENGDGTIGYGHIHVLTAIAYIRTVRFSDGTLWRVDPATVMAEVRKVAPRIKEAGPLVPEREKRDEKR